MAKAKPAALDAAPDPIIIIAEVHEWPMPPAKTPTAPAPESMETPFSVFGYAYFTDAAKNRYEAIGIRDGNTTYITFEKRSEAGALLYAARIQPPADPRGAGYKFDGFTVAIMRGTTLTNGSVILAGWSHQIIAGARFSLGFPAVVPCNYVSGAGSQSEALPVMGALVEMAQPPSEPPPSGAVDLTAAALDAIAAKVKNMIQAEMNGEMGQQFTKAAKNGGRQAIQVEGAENRIITPRNMGPAYAASYEILQQLDNRTYATILLHKLIEAAYKTLNLPWPPHGAEVLDLDVLAAPEVVPLELPPSSAMDSLDIEDIRRQLAEDTPTE